MVRDCKTTPKLYDWIDTLISSSRKFHIYMITALAAIVASSCHYFSGANRTLVRQLFRLNHPATTSALLRGHINTTPPIMASPTTAVSLRTSGASLSTRCRP